MSLASTTVKVSYDGDGGTVSFPITFIFWADSDIKAIHRSAAGVETVWVLGTQYTLSGGDGATGTLTVKTTPTDFTPAAGTKLIIKSARANTQPTTFPLGGSFPSTNAERAIDQSVRLIQQRTEEIDRSIKMTESSPTTGVTMPEPSASKLLGWNSAGTGLDNYTSADVPLTAISAFITTLIDDVDAATARATLGALGTAGATMTGDISMSGASIFDANASIAAHATTCDPWSLGNYVTLTGTAVTFTAMGNAPQAGAEVEIYMNAAHVFTDGAVFEVDGNANYTAAVGDRVLLRAKSTTAFTVHPMRADGTAVAGGVASQAEMIAGSSTTVSAPPGRMHFHPAMPKAWGLVTYSGGTPTLAADYGITGISDDGAGLVTFTFDANFASTSYAVFPAGNGLRMMAYVTAKAVGSCQIQAQSDDGVAQDRDFSVAFYGTLA